MMSPGNFQEALAFTLDSSTSFLRPSWRGSREREQRGGDRVGTRMRLRRPLHPFPSRREPCGPWTSLLACCHHHGGASWPHADLQGPNGYKDDWFLDCENEDRRGLGTVIPKDFKKPLKSQGTEAESRYLCDPSSEEGGKSSETTA